MLIPEGSQAQQQQQAAVSMGQLGLADYPTQGGEQYYVHDYYGDQYYQPQEEYAGASISEVHYEDL